jgi:hypothetical protein
VSYLGAASDRGHGHGHDIDPDRENGCDHVDLSALAYAA